SHTDRPRHPPARHLPVAPCTSTPRPHTQPHRTPPPTAESSAAPRYLAHNGHHLPATTAHPTLAMPCTSARPYRVRPLYPAGPIGRGRRGRMGRRRSSRRTSRQGITPIAIRFGPRASCRSIVVSPGTRRIWIRMGTASPATEPLLDGLEHQNRCADADIVAVGE